MNLENIMPSEISQTQQNKHWTIPLHAGPRNKFTDKGSSLGVTMA
jgi:hypothetical protein